MMRLNVGLKSTLLALAVMVAVPVTTTRTQEVQSIFARIQPMPVAMTAAFLMWVRLQTKSDKEQFKTKAADDYKKTWESFDLLDTAFYKHLVMLFDKYVVGRKIKFVQKDIPQEDGSTIKGKKTLSEEPYGALGLFDAYVLSQIKGFSEQIPALIGLYVLLDYANLVAKNPVKQQSA